MKEIYAADWLDEQQPSDLSERMAMMALRRKMENDGCTEIIDIRFAIEAEQPNGQFLHVYRATIK